MNPDVRIVTFTLAEPPDTFWLPVPPAAPGQTAAEPVLVGAIRLACIHSNTTPQPMWLARSSAPGPVEVRYSVTLGGERAAGKLRHRSSSRARDPRARARCA